MSEKRARLLKRFRNSETNVASGSRELDVFGQELLVAQLDFLGFSRGQRSGITRNQRRFLRGRECAAHQLAADAKQDIAGGYRTQFTSYLVIDFRSNGEESDNT